MEQKLGDKNDPASTVDVLGELLGWSTSLPDWQRDALRRLVAQGELTQDDLEELVTLCKAGHGLADIDRVSARPLEKKHLPQRIPGSAPTNLSSLTHLAGVNALVAGQQVKFGPGLTIVFGSNAAGKSGYTRILKRACRARGAESILGNVFQSRAPARPSATISFSSGDEKHEFSWTDEDEPHPELGRVSVFDTHCASVYLKEKTDVAFRPFGLDLFDQLSRACEDVKRILEREQRILEAQRNALPEVPEGTEVAKLLSSLTSLTKLERVTTLGTLTKDERRRLADLRKRLDDLDAEDPKKRAVTLRLRGERVGALARHLEALEVQVGDEGLAQVFDEREALVEAEGAATEDRRKAFPSELLPGSGAPLWRRLWEAARTFSAEGAYEGEPFPHVHDGARCVLCQQDLSPEASKRLAAFEESVQSTLQQEADRARESYRKSLLNLQQLSATSETILSQLDELRLENEELAVSAEALLAAARKRQQAATAALDKNRGMPAKLPVLQTALAAGIHDEATSLQSRSSEVAENKGQASRADQLKREVLELAARESLGKGSDAVIAEIERRKELAAFSLCVKETNTREITRKSTEVTKRAVTDQLTSAFQTELKRIGFTHLEVELEAAGGQRGALYHRLVLKRAPGADLHRVVSEGEARALAITSFFAELATASDDSAILFDDPVSSLDHSWRENVARRLAREAQRRQVVVFTHDIVFVLALADEAEKAGSDCAHQYLRNDALGAGVTSQELPWVAMRAKDRIGVLKRKCQEAGKLFRTGPREAYDKEAIFIYGLLREAWERALEEILLAGIVQRYRPSIQTRQVGVLSDITKADCETLDAGMAKSSRWLPGHDQAAAENVDVPDVDELAKDVAELEDWVKSITKRRK